MDIEAILNNSGVYKKSDNEAAKIILEFSENYSSDELVQIYCYILTHSDDINLLTTTVKLSATLNNTSIIPSLVDILLLKSSNLNNDSDDIINLRVQCIKSIACYKDTSVMSPLLYCLNNKNENYKIRLACADALGRIGDKYAVMPLINILQDEEEKSVYVKESATFALGLIGDTSAIDPLVKIMEAKQGLWDKFSFLKEKIVEALGRLNINNEKVLRVLKVAMLDSSPMVRINTIEALMNSDYQEAPELIKKALHDEDEEVQRNALIALYNVTGRDILDEVISLPGYSKFLKDEAKNMIEEYEEG